jgi:glycosyltransferase involved in cell wall biosynthesis
MMKVLIVHHQMALFGGAELVVVRLAQYLQRRGHTVRILTASTSPHSEYEGLDIVTPQHETRWHLWDGSLSSLKELTQVFTSLHKLCRELADDCDVVNAHNFPSVWASPHWKKIVWMCNEVPDLWHRNHVGVASQLLRPGRFADRVIVRSRHPVAVVADENIAQHFRSRYGFEPRVIPYGIDAFTLRGSPSGEEFTIIQPSMISPSKCQLETLSAAPLDVRVIFAGYYEPGRPYTKQVSEASRGRDVVITGHVTRAELQELYSQSHVAVFPGRGQGSWLGPFEALSAGVPVIVSPNLSCSSLIAKHNLGLVTYNLTEALRTAHNNYTQYQEQALKASVWVRENLTWDKFGASMEELMQ